MILSKNGLIRSSKLGLFLVLLCFVLPIISALSLNSFNDSTTIGNLTFVGNSNLTQYLSIPQNTVITNGYLNLSGFNSTSYPTNLSLYFGNTLIQNYNTNTSTKLNETDLHSQTMTTFGPTTNTYGELIQANKQNYIWAISQYPCAGHNCGTNCYVKSGDGTITYANGTFVGSSDVCYLNQSYTLQAGVYYRILIKLSNTGYSKTSGTAYPYVNNYNNYISGIDYNGANLTQILLVNNISVTGDIITNYFNQTNNRSSNLYSQLNTYLNTCSFVNGNCSIPFIFHSDTAGILQYSALNFSDNGFISNSATYNAQTLEGNVENFTLNISSSNTLTSAVFVYNGTSYGAAVSNNGNNYSITSSIAVPINSSQATYKFYWNLNFAGNQTNSSSYNQTVNSISLDDCSVNTVKLLNLTGYDEQTQARLNETMEITLQLYPTNQYPNPNYTIANLSKTFTTVPNASVCLSISILNGTNYYMDAQIRYSAASYVTKLYNIQKYLVSNITTFQNINLYDLLASAETDFLITVKDSNFLPLQGALVFIQRKYIGDGVYRNVEIPKTDNDGQAIGHFDLNSVIYQIVVVKNGVNIATFNDIAVVCTDKSIGQCYLNLNAASGSTGFSDYNNFNNLNYFLTVNQTGTATITFNTVDGTSVTMNLTAITYGLNSTVLCSKTLFSSAGTFSCSPPASFTNGTFEVDVYDNGFFLTRQLYSLSLPVASKFGNEGYIYLLLLIITIPFMFITDTIGFMVAIVLGFVIAGSLFLYNMGGIIGTGSAIMWLIVAVGAIIYKLSERRREM